MQDNSQFQDAQLILSWMDQINSQKKKKKKDLLQKISEHQKGLQRSQEKYTDHLIMQ